MLMRVVCGLLTGQQRRVVMPFHVNKYPPVWVGLLWGLYVIGLLSVSVRAEGRGSIGGVILRAGQEIAEHRIMLVCLGPNREVQRIPGQTDAQGQFFFDNLETGELCKYVVGILYAGQLYQSEPVRLAPGQQRTGVVVEVGAASPQPVEEGTPRLQIVNHLMLIAFRGDHLEIREVVRLLNHGAASSAGSAGPSLHLPLPQGYYNLTDVQGLTPEHVRLHMAGLYYTAPLPPGEQRVIYTYSLPFRHDVMTILAQRTLPTAALDILIEDEHFVATSDLQPNGRVAIEPHTFFHFRGINLAAHTRSWLQLIWRTESRPLLRIGAYSLTICLALCGIGLPLYGAWCRRGGQAQGTCITPEQLQALYAERLDVLQTVIHLDNQRAAGTIEEGMYQQQRQGYKKHLLELVSQLQQAQKETQRTN
jgi:hypothetical protein